LTGREEQGHENREEGQPARIVSREGARAPAVILPPDRESPAGAPVAASDSL
jgi:hypothetical protein